MNSLEYMKKIVHRGNVSAVPWCKDAKTLIISENRKNGENWIPIKYAAFVDDQMVYNGCNLNKAFRAVGADPAERE